MKTVLLMFEKLFKVFRHELGPSAFFYVFYILVLFFYIWCDRVFEETWERDIFLWIIFCQWMLFFMYSPCSVCVNSSYSEFFVSRLWSVRAILIISIIGCFHTHTECAHGLSGRLGSNPVLPVVIHAISSTFRVFLGPKSFSNGCCLFLSVIRRFFKIYSAYISLFCTWNRLGEMGSFHNVLWWFYLDIVDTFC